MKSRLQLTLIIPTFNRSALLETTLCSALRQSVDQNVFEVIVVDDGSEDNTAEMVLTYSSKLNIRYVYQENKGRRVSLARNTGIELALGEICLFLDSGMLMASDFIAEHIKLHQESTTPVIQLGYIYGFSSDNFGIDQLKPLIHFDDVDRSISYFKEHQIFIDHREPFYLKYRYDLSLLPAPWVFFWSGNVSVKKSELIAVGMFDINFDPNWGMEDIDLGYRLFKVGIKTIVNRNAGAIHYPHDRNNEDNQIERVINEAYFHKKFNTAETELYLQVNWLLNEYVADTA